MQVSTLQFVSENNIRGDRAFGDEEFPLFVKKTNSNSLQSEKPPSRLKRLSSFTNVMSPLNSFRRSFSRNRQPSQETSSSSRKSRKSSGITTVSSVTSHDNDCSLSFAHPRPPPVTPQETHTSRRRETSKTSSFHLPRSSTTSYLPLASRNGDPSPESTALIHSQTTAHLRKSKIPTPANVHSRLPTPLDTAGMYRCRPAHSRRESFVLLNGAEPRPRSRIPTPVKRDSVELFNSRQSAAWRRSIGRGGGESRPVRSKTESNLFALPGRRPALGGRQDSSNVRCVRPDSSTVPLIGCSPESTAARSPIKDENFQGRLSPSSSVDGGVMLANYAFSPRRYTPSRALENAMSTSVNVSPLKNHTNRPRTPPTVKRLENPAAPKSLPRHSSGHPISHYSLLQPIQVADAPTAQPATSIPPTERPTLRTSVTNVSIRSRPPAVRTPSGSTAQHSPPAPASPTPPRPHPRHVSSYEPAAFWAGRFSAAHDASLARAFDVGARPTSAADVLRTRPSADGRSSSRSTLPPAAESDRDRAARLFARLEEDCVRDEAAASLRAFRAAYARRCGWRAWEGDGVEGPRAEREGERRVGGAVRGVEGKRVGGDVDGVPAVGSAGKKTGIIDRLWMARGARLASRARKSGGKAGLEDDLKGLVGGDA